MLRPELMMHCAYAVYYFTVRQRIRPHESNKNRNGNKIAKNTHRTVYKIELLLVMVPLVSQMLFRYVIVHIYLYLVYSVHG